MSSDRLLEEFPGSEDESHRSGPGQTKKTAQGATAVTNRLIAAWDNLSRLGLGETAFRFGANVLSLALLLVVIWALRAFYFYLQENQPAIVPAQHSAFAAPLPTKTPPPDQPGLPVFALATPPYDGGIPRMAMLHTTVPSRPRTEVSEYTVQEGDTIFGIAEQFGLKPETILWGNTYILGDNPHSLRPGQVLNILPLDGTYHKWSAGEGLNGVARGYNVTPEDILSWPGNNLSAETIGDLSNPNIEPGTMLVVPGGERSFVSWSAPRISRENPGVAKLLGPGWCGAVVDGAVGIGAFIWPSANHWLSGYDYSPATNHFGIDIDGDMGDPLYAMDNGVVVYAGWNDHGYGNVVVIDHGNGWQTLYAHMNFINAGCGQSVFQGGLIGSMGSTGNSSGPHLHLEMLNESYGKVNPWNFLPPP